MKNTLCTKIRLLVPASLMLACTLTLQPPTLAAEAAQYTTETKQQYAGKVLFSAKVNTAAEVLPGELLQSVQLNSSKNLYFTLVLHQPLTRYLQQLAPDLAEQQLNQQGNYQFNFLVDNQLVYSENLNPAAGLPAEKSTQTVLSKPFFSEQNQDSWGRFLWMRFLHSGGDKALDEGTHQLKIQIRPYLQNNNLLLGPQIAEGEITVQIIKPAVTEQQIAIQPIAPTADWIISAEPYDQNLIRALNKKIAQQDFKDISSVVVIKEGKLLLEQYFNGQQRSSLHDSRSVGKSFASTLVGMAIADGFIQNEQQTLATFYPLHNYRNYSAQKAAVSLQQLMTMTSGFAGDDSDPDSAGNEELMYPSPDWVKFALDLPMQNPDSADRSWRYFTAGVVLLGDILQRQLPQGLEAYAEQKLFAPLGIRHYQWQYTPQQVVNTAGGLRLTTLDLAKYGQLYKNVGRWGTKQLIPAKWVEASLSKQVARSTQQDEGYYGYLFWHDCIPAGQHCYQVAYASGNGGNKIFIFKDIPVVVVITATAYNQAYAHPQVNQILSDYILPAILP
jgi:CubicO group peptidase (beta-lactamase class C family)